MVSITSWMEEFTAAVRAAFGERVCCIGLQGSYGRGEAGEHSDIDPVVILSRLTPQDINVYRTLLAGLSDREKICLLYTSDAADD